MIRILDINKREVISEFSAHSGWKISSKFSPDGKSILYGSTTCELEIRDLESEAVVSMTQNHVFYEKD